MNPICRYGNPIIPGPSSAVAGLQGQALPVTSVARLYPGFEQRLGTLAYMHSPNSGLRLTPGLC